jgi:hypothetical protein
MLLAASFFYIVILSEASQLYRDAQSKDLLLL